jgi:hypothetical protein
MLRECPEELVDVPVRQAAALVFDLEKHAVGACVDAEHHGRLRAGELVCVLKQIDDNRGQDLAIGANECSGFAGLHDKPEIVRLCFHCRRWREILNECRDLDEHTIVNPLAQSNLCERSIDEVSEPRQAALEHGSRTAADSDVAGLQYVESSACGVEKIPDLMREESDSFFFASGFGIKDRLIAFFAEF